MCCVCGCNNNELATSPPIMPNIIIEYVDKEGNRINLYSDNLEIISITDEKNDSIGFRLPDYPLLRILFNDGFSIESPKTEKQYEIKYHIPNLLGETIEELRLIFNVNKVYSTFTDAWYNGNKILNFVSFYSLCPECINPQYNIQDNLNIEEFERRKKELMYNGTTAAYIEGFNIYIILPVVKD